MRTKNVAATYPTQGIRVNTVHPGFLWPPTTLAQDGDIPDRLVAETPIWRAGKGSEVASAIASLASDEASFVPGAQLLLDGGYTNI